MSEIEDNDHFDIHWIDLEREPQCKPDPDYPHGIDLDMAKGRWPQCKIKLPYPARRCGVFVLDCKKCGTSIMVTTAGRVDDPRSVALPCDLKSRGPIQ